MSKRSRVRLVGGGVILLLLIAFAVPKYKAILLKTKESTLTVNLDSMRSVIKQYVQDKKKAPQSLQDLVDSGYYRELPIDPMTNSRATWQPVIERERGITDVHSGASSVSSKGTTYSTW